MLNFIIGIVVGVLIVFGFLQWLTDKNCLLLMIWDPWDKYKGPKMVQGEGVHIDELQITRSFKVRKENEAQ